ncbi:hypothetical protein SXANM310S_02165 [Streptomyces xanthochromogenes]
MVADSDRPHPAAVREEGTYVRWLSSHAIVLLALMFTALFTGVVLPAVWSSRPARRRAAAAVLTQILMTVRRHR